MFTSYYHASNKKKSRLKNFKTFVYFPVGNSCALSNQKKTTKLKRKKF